ncbi:hypothetical protein SARC_00090 [Sphaeroforma arctica JP610]|uniref:Uncharacterized protein n=1 Tax=Sphaeroforma arctica JP610 TaxID=667725 RepID=A0A0L0GHL0_9EUKA|nr:hypothetical protein SARC_00090 [Sphaeroforma arctica JP610]KNC87833.1 hypothetical protein SARC_00090 [Sphaeroforma arctica JP610]|eukprot:XP_014161735.1 hypothetical protein SARC_00090 [Sphaeroforma arctica JP610]
MNDPLYYANEALTGETVPALKTCVGRLVVNVRGRRYMFANIDNCGMFIPFDAASASGRVRFFGTRNPRNMALQHMVAGQLEHIVIAPEDQKFRFAPTAPTDFSNVFAVTPLTYGQNIVNMTIRKGTHYLGHGIPDDNGYMQATLTPDRVRMEIFLLVESIGAMRDTGVYYNKNYTGVVANTSADCIAERNKWIATLPPPSIHHAQVKLILATPYGEKMCLTTRAFGGDSTAAAATAAAADVGRLHAEPLYYTMDEQSTFLLEYVKNNEFRVRGQGAQAGKYLARVGDSYDLVGDIGLERTSLLHLRMLHGAQSQVMLDITHEGQPLVLVRDGLAGYLLQQSPAGIDANTESQAMLVYEGPNLPESPYSKRCFSELDTLIQVAKVERRKELAKPLFATRYIIYMIIVVLILILGRNMLFKPSTPKKT